MSVSPVSWAQFVGLPELYNAVGGIGGGQGGERICNIKYFNSTRKLKIKCISFSQIQI